MKKKLEIPDAHSMQTDELAKAKKENQELKQKLHGALIKNKEHKYQVVLSEA